jgi:RNA polymerase sigma-70 factor (ECF subfamily)
LSGQLSPDALFEKSWALTVIGRTYEKLKAQYAETGKSEHFEHLKGHIAMDGDAATYHEIATALGMTEGATKVVVHRLRCRLRELIRAEVAETVAGPD